MSQSKTTKEERLLQAILKETKGMLATSVDVKPIAGSLGFSEKQALKAINLLAKGNFIRKRGEWAVELAPLGLTHLCHST